ncbi:MAG: ATP-binding protein [Verrucomicrobiota bacterium]
MNRSSWRGIGWLKELLATQRPEPAHQAGRIVKMQLHIVLPAKMGVIAVALYYVFFSGWFHELPTPQAVVLQALQVFFVAYLLCNIIATGIIFSWRRFPPGIVQWIVFTLGLLDGIFVAGLIFMTGGFESIAYWIFPGLIVLNALSIPLTVPQLGLNLLLSAFYLSAGVLEASFPTPTLLDLPTNAYRQVRGTNAVGTNVIQAAQSAKNKPWPKDLPYNTELEDRPAEPVIPRMGVLWLLALCCYGVQVLAERQRRVAEEERESAVREAQLHSAGRLAAEFAHQIKNPLAIINNAAYSVRKALDAGRTDVRPQIEIIQEEVERSDRIITQIMGYAQLTEGRVEKLNVPEELDRAVDQVFPAALETGIQVERGYSRNFPPLLMQRKHFSDILVNLLLNARESLHGHGQIGVFAVCRADDSVEISIRDNGPGIPPEKMERIFEAYYSTKEKGTGLGLSIVRHNVELYSGTVRVESELGKGTCFILTFPAKSVIRQAKYT